MVHILPPGRHLPHRPTPHIAHDERLRPQPPHQLQVLVRPETIVLGHAPPDRIHHLGSLRWWPNPILPVVVVGKAAPGPAQHGNVQPRLQRQQLLGADPPQKAEVGSAAAKRDVLAVVEPEAVALERERRAPKTRARLVERHLGAGIRQLDRSGESGEATSDDRRFHAPTAWFFHSRA